jgi:NAD(P)H dehydrogenase (quinone)
LAVANAYCAAVRAKGHEADLRDLYRMNFAPTLDADELPKPSGFSPGRDVLDERRLLARIDVFVFVYPFWMNAQPAMMKGYIDRVFGLGFAYGSVGRGNVPLLRGRKMISFSSSGAPKEWVVDSGAWDAARRLFDRHFADVSGLELVDHVHFGGVVAGIRKDVVERHLDCVREAVGKYF